MANLLVLVLLKVLLEGTSYFTTSDNTGLRLANIASQEDMWLKPISSEASKRIPEKSNGGVKRTADKAPIPLPSKRHSTGGLSKRSVEAPATLQTTKRKSTAGPSTSSMENSPQRFSATPLRQTRINDKENQIFSSIARKISRLQEPISDIESKQDAILAAVKTLIKQGKKKNINNYKVDIELKISKLFCRSLYRELSEEQYARAVTDSISDGSRESEMFREGVSYARRLVTQYRSEERRKHLGNGIYKSYKHLSNKEVATRIMRGVHAPVDEVTEDLYVKHVAIMRKFIEERREEAEVCRQLYNNFKKFVEEEYPGGIVESDWEDILS